MECLSLSTRGEVSLGNGAQRRAELHSTVGITENLIRSVRTVVALLKAGVEGTALRLAVTLPGPCGNANPELPQTRTSLVRHAANP